MPKRLSEDPTNYRHMSLRLLLGFLFSSVIGLVAYRRKSLDKSGVLGAIVCGTSIMGMGGWSWGLSLVYFFVSSSLLSSFRAREKVIAATDKFSKGSQRDLSQVVANGGITTPFALCYWFSQTPGTAPRAKTGLTGTLGTPPAATWATQLGTLRQAHPPSNTP